LGFDVKASAANPLAKHHKTPPGYHIFLITCCLFFLVPFLIIISASLTEDSVLSWRGFSLFIPVFDTLAYRYLFTNPKIVLDAYSVTMFITVVGTAIGVFVMAMAAFCLSRAHAKLRGVLTFYIFFPALFSGGIVSSYIINTRYLGLKDTIWALILPNLINIYFVMMLRTFFRQLPASIFESAKIDGASEYRIFFTMLLPLSTPVLATVAFLNALNKWNEWYNALLYISVDRLVPLQYLLQRMMSNIQILRQAIPPDDGGRENTAGRKPAHGHARRKHRPDARIFPVLSALLRPRHDRRVYKGVKQSGGLFYAVA
jgi:putative aldouronate transport system permease protein